MVEVGPLPNQLTTEQINFDANFNPRLADESLIVLKQFLKDQAGVVDETLLARHTTRVRTAVVLLRERLRLNKPQRRPTSCALSRTGHVRKTEKPLDDGRGDSRPRMGRAIAPYT